VLRVVNSQDREVTAQLHLTGFTPAKPLLQITGLSGPLGAVNTADHPRACVPQESRATHGLIDNTFRQPFPPHSLTVIRLE
jgi:alpha-L-arabinofuranosidase